MADAPNGSERRQGTRHLTCVPVHIHEKPGAAPHTAIIRELSVTGAQVLTGLKLEVGAPLSLDLYLHDDVPHPAVGKVVRVEPRPHADLWPFLVAIHFDSPLSGLEAEIEALSRKLLGKDNL